MEGVDVDDPRGGGGAAAAAVAPRAPTDAVLQSGSADACMRVRVRART